MISTLLITLLLFYSVSARQPQCANGQAPKMDKSGRPIQCLPGSSQRVVCGTQHTCFFTGMNYVCCPSNEPSADNQPTCQKPHLTVLGSDGLPMRCSALTRSCPSKSMFCSDTGLAYICCERSIGSEPPKEVEPEPRHEETLECPINSLGVLTDKGRRVVCNSKRRCPGRHQFCYGGLKRSICCERYDTANDQLASSEAAMEKPLKRKLKTVSLSSRSATLNGSPNVIKSNTFVSDKISFMPRGVSVALKPKKESRTQKSGSVQQLDGSTGRTRELIVEKTNKTSHGSYKPKSVGLQSSRLDRLNSSEKSRNKSFESARPATRRLPSTTTTTEKPTTRKIRVRTTEKPVDIIKESLESDETVAEDLAPAEEFVRARAHAVKTQDSQVKPLELDGQSFANQPAEDISAVAPSQSTDFAPSKPLPQPPSMTVPKEEKKEMAHTYLMQQIRDGWPYNERFYRPGEQQ